MQLQGGDVKMCVPENHTTIFRKDAKNLFWLFVYAGARALFPAAPMMRRSRSPHHLVSRLSFSSHHQAQLFDAHGGGIHDAHDFATVEHHDALGGGGTRGQGRRNG